MANDRLLVRATRNPSIRGDKRRFMTDGGNEARVAAEAKVATATDQIDAMPTKAFFVDMLTRDIPLEQAVLDLVDNSVDGAKKLARSGLRPFNSCKVRLRINAGSFSIWDNCGGFDTESARHYAFRFGRSRNSPALPNSIGQFGVGMKRALFKFGRHFVVRSTTDNEKWSIDIDVDKWENDESWHFDWDTRETLHPEGAHLRGTYVGVDRLRPAVSSRFSTELFRNSVKELIKAKHRQFIAQGLAISVNGRHLDATDLYLLVREDLNPGIDQFLIKNESEEDVSVRIIAGVGSSSPRESGWYVICNGRVVLEADRTIRTGWGLVENQVSYAPAYHNQFARFRGIVSFDSLDSARVPWNTTKDGIDVDNPVWQRAFTRMMEMMRPVIDFLYELDRDVDEYTREHSGLYQHVDRANLVKTDTLTSKRDFAAPSRDSVLRGPRQVKIQYSRPIDDIEFLQESLGVYSAKAVGEKTFDLTLAKQKR